jgi:HEAT repeat protein
LNDKNKWRRHWAARLLGEIRDPQAIDALINELNKRTDDAGTIAFSLASIGDKRALPAMENALDLPSWVQRTGINYATGDGYSIAGSMARMGPAAKPFFLHSLKSKDVNRLRNAKAGLDLLNGGDGLLVQYWQDTMNGIVKGP